MNKSPPKVSIITPSYNSERYIRDSIESVFRQSYSNIEHIVIDGKSTDSTIDILSEYDGIKTIHENDNGIYDALNKGVKQATGELIGWLNSDDMYAEGAIQKLVSEYRQNPESRLVAGSCEKFKIDNGKKKIIDIREFTPKKKFEKGIISHRGTMLNGCLLSEELINEVGNFNDNLDITGDTEYLIRLAAKKPKISTTSDVVYKYRQHEGSITFNKSYSFDADRETRLKEGISYNIKFARNPQTPDPLRKKCLSDFRHQSGSLLKNYIKRLSILPSVTILKSILLNDPLWPIWASKMIYSRNIKSLLD